MVLYLFKHPPNLSLVRHYYTEVSFEIRGWFGALWCIVVQILFKEMKSSGIQNTFSNIEKIYGGWR